MPAAEPELRTTAAPPRAAPPSPMAHAAQTAATPLRALSARPSANPQRPSTRPAFRAPALEEPIRRTSVPVRHRTT